MTVYWEMLELDLNLGEIQHLYHFEGEQEEMEEKGVKEKEVLVVIVVVLFLEGNLWRVEMLD